MAAPSVSGGLTQIDAWSTAGVAGTLDDGGGVLATVNNAGLDGGSGTSRCIVSTNDTEGTRKTFTSFDGTVARRIIGLHFCFRAMEVSSGLDTIANSGIRFSLFSGGGTTNYRRWAVNGSDHIPNMQKYSWCFVDSEVAGFQLGADGGTWDPTDITGCEMHAAASGAACHFYVNYMAYVDPFLAIDGEGGNKGDFSDIIADMEAQDSLDGKQVIQSQTSNQILTFCSWGVGDGSTLTHFSESGKNWEFPQKANATDLRILAHYRDNQIGFEIDGSGSDVIDFTDCSWTRNDDCYWNVLAQSGDAIDILRCSVTGPGETIIEDEADLDEVVFDGADEINAGTPTGATAPDMTDCTITNSVDTRAISVSDTTNMVRMTLSNGTTGCNIDATGTQPLDGWTFSGLTNDIENSSGGAVTLALSNTTYYPSVLNTGGGSTTTITNNQTVKVTVTDSSETAIVGARVRITATETVGTITTGDVILEGTSGIGGILQTTTFNYEEAFEPSGLSIQNKVRSASGAPFYKASTTTGIITIGGFDVIVQLQDD